jgi:hypothetical protein
MGHLRCSMLLATCQKDLAAAEMEAAACLKTAAIATAKLNEQVRAFYDFFVVCTIAYSFAMQESLLHALQTRVPALEAELSSTKQKYTEACSELEKLQLELTQSNNAAILSAASQAQAAAAHDEVFFFFFFFFRKNPAPTALSFFQVLSGKLKSAEEEIVRLHTALADQDEQCKIDASKHARSIKVVCLFDCI